MSWARGIFTVLLVGWASLIWWGIILAILATLAATAPAWVPVVLGVLMLRAACPER